MTELIFYSFAFFMVAAGFMVITLKNPVHSVLFLIFAFFNAAGLFILVGAEYIAMTLVIVYVGAVAILFLFVIMMLNINVSEIREGFLKHMPLGAGLGLLVFVQIYLAFKESAKHFPEAKETIDKTVHNTEALGRIIYTDYFFAFQAAGIVLLVAMIGAIALTLTHSKNVRRQNINKQVLRDPKDSIEVIDVKSGQGVKI